MTIYKPARLFASASQRRFAPTIATTPVEIYERCHRSARSSSRAGGDQWLSPSIFYTGHKRKKNLILSARLFNTGPVGSSITSVSLENVVSHLVVAPILIFGAARRCPSTDLGGHSLRVPLAAGGPNHFSRNWGLRLSLSVLN
jgi:hypothetical protein